jgi:flagellar biosynthesis protein FliQ
LSETTNAESRIKSHIKYLIALSFLAKLCVILLTTVVLGSYMDLYLMHYYYEHTISNLQGSYTYISYYYEYPILIFIPSIIALIPSLILNSEMVFALVFASLMIICDCVTTICIYLISYKIWNSPKKAFVAAGIYLTAISTVYFAIIDYGAFPTSLLMIGLTLLLYSEVTPKWARLNEYAAIVLGYFSKIFPIIALPFIILYKSRSTSLKHEIVSASKVIIPVSLLLFVTLFIFNPGSVFKTYFPARVDIGYFPNTIIWTLHVWLHDIFHINITIDTVLLFVYTCMIVGGLILFYSALKFKKQDPVILLKFILCGIMLIVLSFKVRSPSYILWFTPIICILICDNIYKIGLFYAIQVLAYIEFPLTFWSLWTNIEYTNPIYSTEWYMALLLFTFEFLLLLLLTWVAIEPVKLYKQIFKNAI